MNLVTRLATVLGAVNYDPDAVVWSNAAVANGGTVSKATLKAVSDFIAGLKADGVWSAVQAIGGVGDNLSAALVAFGFGGATVFTNTNFVSGDYVANSGLTGNGSSKYLNSGITPGGTSTGFLGAYFITAITTGTPQPIGCNNSGSTQIFRLRYSSGIQASWGGTAAATGASGTGLIVIERSGATALNLYQAGSSVGSSATSTTPASATVPIFVFCGNNNGTPGTYTDKTLGLWIIGNASLGASGQSALSARVTTLLRALGRI